jgi:hypothetical integral membrane protein (TIGR02206 family)
MAYFWLFKSDLPSGMGVKTFSLTHLSLLAASTAAILLVIYIYRRQTDAGKRKIKWTVTILMLAVYFSRWLWVTGMGYPAYILKLLPLHLCGFSVILETAAVASNKLVLKEFSYSLSLPGAIAAMTYPNLGPYPLLSFRFFEFAMTHTLLILIPLLFVFGDGFRPSVRRLPQCIALFLVFAGVVYFINPLLGSNYLFLNYAEKGTILILFEKWFGSPGYLIPVILVFFFTWFVLYAPWELTLRRRGNKK